MSTKNKNNRSALKSLVRNFIQQQKQQHPYVTFILKSSDDPTIWIGLIENVNGDDNEFTGGEYLFEVRATKDYPYKTPEFTILTPNGIYNPDKKVCINIGVYHTNNWPASLGMGGFAAQLPNGLIGWKTLGSGINLVNHSNYPKKIAIDKLKNLASNSRVFNRVKYPKYIERFENTKFKMLLRIVNVLQLSHSGKKSICKWLRLNEERLKR